jgi:hypothetical protein
MISKAKFVQAKFQSTIFCAATISAVLIFCWAIFRHKFVGYQDNDWIYVVMSFALVVATFWMWQPAIERACIASRGGFIISSPPGAIGNLTQKDISFKSADLATDKRPPRSTPRN